MKHLRSGIGPAIATCMTTLLLTACGGGGGGVDPKTNPGGNNPPSDSGLLKLNDSNGGLVALIGLLNAKGAANGAIFTGAVNLLNAGFTVINAQLQSLGNSGTESCEVGGDYTWTFTDSDADTALSSGDSWLVSNNNCEDDVAFTNGSTGFDINQLVSSDTTDEHHSDISFTYNLSGSLFGETTQSLGSYTWKSDTTDGIIVTQDLFVSSYQSIINDEVIAMTKLSYVETKDESTLTESLIVGGKMRDETLGDYSIETQQTLIAINPPFLVGDKFYYEGSFTVTLKTGSVKLTALSETDVQLNVDIDGDGSVDQTSNTTWGALTTQYLSHLGFI